MYRASSAHLQEVNDANCICMQPLASSFSVGGRLVQSLKGDLVSTCREGRYQWLHTYTICIIDLLKMSG
jgi:hypothetical protein